MSGAAELLALSLTERIASIGVMVSSLELLARHRDLRDQGLFSWEIASSRTHLSNRSLAIGKVLFSHAGAVTMIVVRLLAAVALWVVPGGDAARTGLCVIVALSYGGVFWRTPLGHDGADQMTYLVFLSAALARAVGGARSLTVALLFVAAQATLGYFAAGLAKVVSPVWVKEGLKGILGTLAYGHASMHRLMSQRPRLARTLAAGVVGWECLFPLGVAAGGPALIVMLASGVAFHAVTAVTMGLNNFVWAFAATYPAILYLREPALFESLATRLAGTAP